VNAGCLALLDHVARVGATPDLVAFLPMLLKLLQALDELSPKVIFVFATLSSRRFLAEKLNVPALVQ